MTEEEHCREAAAAFWGLPGAPLADLIARERAAARAEALEEAAGLVEDMRPAGGPWTTLGAAAKGVRALKSPSPAGGER